MIVKIIPGDPNSDHNNDLFLLVRRNALSFVSIDILWKAAIFIYNENNETYRQKMYAKGKIKTKNLNATILRVHLLMRTKFEWT